MCDEMYVQFPHEKEDVMANEMANEMDGAIDAVMCSIIAPVHCLRSVSRGDETRPVIFVYDPNMNPAVAFVVNDDASVRVVIFDDTFHVTFDDDGDIVIVID